LAHSDIPENHFPKSESDRFPVPQFSGTARRVVVQSDQVTQLFLVGKREDCAMSEVRLVVREEHRDWSGNIHGSFADRAIASLAADPVTLKELEAALARFAKPNPQYPFSANFLPGLRDEPYDAGLVVIDLAARLIVLDSTYSSPDRDGYVEYHNGSFCTETALRYHLADDWQFLKDGQEWRPVAEQRRGVRAMQPRFDARTVFYGPPLLAFLARECLSAFARRTEITATVRADWVQKARMRLAKQSGVSPEEVDSGLLTDEEITPRTWPGQEVYASPYYETLSQIHASWLLTPRQDLNGACPREVALERHGHLVWDLQDRCEQWSRLGGPAPGLSESSHAFQLGGFGTHELVKYYDLVRELLWSCWDRLEELAQAPITGHALDALTAGDFLSTEVPRLESVREAWFDAPDPECHGRTPRSIINRERARIPEAMSGHDAMVDADCPCCQMMADLPGPMFWHLDGCNNDDDFAFDTSHRTREEWEEDRRQWDEHNRRFSATWAERERLGVTDSRGEGSVWSRAFSMADGEIPLGVRIFGLGCRLAELIGGVRADGHSASSGMQHYIDQLNRAFGNLRELLQDSDSSLAAALISPVLGRFADNLHNLAKDRPELATQCESLVDDLDRLLDPAAEEPSPDDGDEDIPF
jgi:hypothetical protein